MRAFLIYSALVMAGLLPWCQATAEVNADAVSAYSDTTRQRFIRALDEARHGTFSAQSNLAHDLRNYPLYPYLTAADLRHELASGADGTLDRRIDAFLADYPDLPPAERLESAWLDDLADRGRWSKILEHTQGLDTTSARCRAEAARIGLGRGSLANARALYDVGESQPAECNPVFEWLADQGALDSGLIRSRAHKAILGGDTGLAQYLAGQASGDAPVIGNWLDLTNNPRRLPQAAPGLDDDIAVHVFKRYVLAAPEAAADALPSLVDRFGIDAAGKYEMQRYVALLFAEEHRPEALLWFARVDHARLNRASDEHALGWEIRAAIHDRRWPLVIAAINALPPAIAQDEEWRYWKARALAATGRSDAARALYRPLAAERSYHGYLAADALNQDYQFNEQRVPDDPAIAARLAARPGYARARELHALGMESYAYLEWQAMMETLPQDEQMQAARRAYEWQWYARAILTLADADYWNDLDIRYPTPFRDDVRAAAAANGLDPAFVYAVVRTESLFQPAVTSPVGAHGLMQLMPGTARLVARQMGRPAPSSTDLNDPRENTTLGARYLADMVEDWGGNLALATASYNAGPGKVAQWLPQANMAPDIWIATIPYTETRQYVQRVMSHMTVFQYRLSESITRLNSRIDSVRPAYPDRKTSF